MLNILSFKKNKYNYFNFTSEQIIQQVESADTFIVQTTTEKNYGCLVNTIIFNHLVNTLMISQFTCYLPAKSMNDNKIPHVSQNGHILARGSHSRWSLLPQSLNKSAPD